MKLLEIIGQWFQNITYTFNVIKELCCEPCVISWRLNFWPHNSAFRCKWKYYIPYCKSICSLWNCVELPSALKGCWRKHYKVWILWEAVEHCGAQPLQWLCWTDAFPKAAESPHDKDAMANLSSVEVSVVTGPQASRSVQPWSLQQVPQCWHRPVLEGKRHRRRHLYNSARLTRAD